MPKQTESNIYEQLKFMKTIILILSLFLITVINPCYSQGDKIKTPIVLSSKDTINVGDKIRYKDGSLSNGKFKYAYTINGFGYPLHNVPAGYSGKISKIRFFRHIEGVYAAVTMDAMISLENAISNNEIEILSTSSKHNTNNVSENQDTIIRQGNPYPRNILNELSKIKWTFKDNDIKSMFDSYLTVSSRHNFDDGEYAELKLTDIPIGAQKYELSFVMGADGILKRMILNTSTDLNENNSHAMFDEFGKSISSVCGNSLDHTDKTGPIHVFYKEWVTNDLYFSGFLMSGGSVQLMASEIKPLIDEPNFRQTKWTFSKDQVLKTEDLKLIVDEKDMLIYGGKLSNLAADVIYLFSDNKLVRSKYFIKEKHSNKNDYISDYLNLKEALTSKYGKPKNDNITWRNKLYKDDIENFGTAISIGHLVYFCEWQTPLTAITIALIGENYEISLQIEYKSRVHQHIESDAKKEKLLNDL